jgi:hypothetical protein
MAWAFGPWAVGGDRDFDLSIEGLDSRQGVDNQEERLRRSLRLLSGVLAE